MGEVERYPDGTFCWVDLGTDDAPGAKAFYGGLFGWEFDDLPTGDKGTYTICRLGGKAVAGLYDRAEEASWGSYIKAEDVDGVARRARELGWPPSVTRQGPSCRCRGRGSSSRPRW
jgi:uncharacterized protein